VYGVNDGYVFFGGPNNPFTVGTAVDTANWVGELVESSLCTLQLTSTGSRGREQANNTITATSNDLQNRR
jgi:hypothetical protein